MGLVVPYEEPWATNYQRQSDDAWNRAESMSADELRALRPPLPQIIYLPPRFGYGTPAERTPTIMSVFGLDRSNATLPSREQLQTGRNRDQTHNSLGDGKYQGSDRNTNYDGLGVGTTGGSST